MKKPPPRAPSVERSLEVHDAFERGPNPVLEEMSDDNNSDHHWNQTKKPKLTIPSNLNSLRGITSASANLEGAKDQVFFFFFFHHFFLEETFLLFMQSISYMTNVYLIAIKSTSFEHGG